MSFENVQEEFVGERNCTEQQAGLLRTGRQGKRHERVVAFKFGGSSLLGAERMLRAAGLVQAETKKSGVCVVVSAMKGVTDHLLLIDRALAAGKTAQARREAEAVIDLHFEALQDLRLEEEQARRVRHELHLLERDLLHEVLAQRASTTSAERADRLASFGERFSTRLFAAALEKLGVPAVPVASSEFVVTCDTFRDAHPHLEKTRDYGRKILLPLLEEDLVPVVTGFIGATPDGRITTLGRNSSDFSGAIIAHVIEADELVIWTDVDGIYTANPHASAEARLLHELSHDEALALAASGAKVLHAKVLPLAAETEMVVWVRNTFHPEAPGTRIASSRELSAARQKEDAA